MLTFHNSPQESIFVECSSIAQKPELETRPPQCCHLRNRPALAVPSYLEYVKQQSVENPWRCYIRLDVFIQLVQPKSLDWLGFRKYKEYYGKKYKVDPDRDPKKKEKKLVFLGLVDNSSGFVDEGELGDGVYLDGVED